MIFNRLVLLKTFFYTVLLTMVITSCGGGGGGSLGTPVIINIAPFADAGPDLDVNEQTLVLLNGSASDSDGTIYSILWSQESGTEVALSNPNILNPSFISPKVDEDEILSFTLSVTDDQGKTTTDNVLINVIANKIILSVIEEAEVGTILGKINFVNKNDITDIELSGINEDIFGITNNLEVFVAGVLEELDRFDQYNLRATASNEGGTVETLNITINVKKTAVNAWSTLQEQIDSQGDGAVIDLDPNLTYVLDSALNLRNYSGVKFNGHGATIMRSNSRHTSTKLANNYKAGSTMVIVESVPENFRVGDELAIAKGIAIDQVTNNPRKIVSISGNTINLSSSFYDDYTTDENAIVFKTFALIHGLPSHIPNGSNPSTIIENIFFDGNARNNKINYGWVINMAIGLHGGKDSIIRNNHFVDMPNETIVGHGVVVDNNIFDGLNGSAFHTSVHDNTKQINGLASFINNTVTNVNRIDKYLSGHSEGAITFSWGGGNLNIENNYFSSETGNYGVMGIFAGQPQNTDENLIVTSNEAYNFEWIIKILSPDSSPSKNILITDNLFSNAGINDFTHLAGDTTMRFGCNELLNGTEIIIDPSNSACE